MKGSTQTETADDLRHGKQIRASEKENERAGCSPEAEGGQQDGRHVGQIKEDTDRSSGEPWRTLHKVNSVHLSFPSKAVEQWSGTFGSHALFLFGQ